MAHFGLSYLVYILKSMIPPLVGNITQYQFEYRIDIQAPTFIIKCHHNSFFVFRITLIIVFNMRVGYPSTNPYCINENIRVILIN